MIGHGNPIESVVNESVPYGSFIFIDKGCLYNDND